jgi:flagellar biosynthesis protein FlhF
MADVRLRNGEDAMIVRTRGPAETDGVHYEVVVAPADAVESLRACISPRAQPRLRGPGTGPFVLALVGPSGAGKTTTAAKLALHSAGFGERHVGLLTLDTYRAAAIEQIHAYAEVAGLALEVADRAADVPAALARLGDCDVVIVDTPGRNPRGALDLEWRAPFEACAADEVHLVIPAGSRADVACAFRDAFRWAGLTHALITKLDEVPGEIGIAELAERIGLPTRWITDGQDIPVDLRPATPRILGTLGAGREALARRRNDSAPERRRQEAVYPDLQAPGRRRAG